jgi:hypothetical protein
MSYDIELGQGDSDDIGIVLISKGSPANLSNFTVSCIISDGLGGTPVIITCNDGATISITSDNYLLLGQTSDKIGTDVSLTKAQGGVTIPITATTTQNSGTFSLEFLAVDTNNKQVTFSNNENYYTMHITKKLTA